MLLVKLSQKTKRQIFSPKVYKVSFMSVLGSCYAVGKTSYER